jgi:cytochrome P450
MPFDMTKAEKNDHFMTTIHKFMKSVSILSAIPWLTSLGCRLPANSAVKDLEEYSRDCFQNTREKGSSRTDLFYYLLGEDQDGTKLIELGLVIDSRTAIVGGSDRTAIAIGCLMFYLISHQDKYKRLQDEILAHGEQMDNVSLIALPYLGAVMRLVPPIHRDSSELYRPRACS